MASLNPLTREVVFKIVFYGPGLGGKTTTLQHIHAASKPEHRGKMVSLATPMDRTLYFDFLPLRMPLLHGMHVRLQLFTVPGQVYFGATRRLVLTGADGVVFVADSQTGRQDANQEALEDLVMNLAENNLALLGMPHSFHWNKRDLPDILSTADLDRTLNRQGAPSLGTVATTGDGVFVGLERIARLVFQAYEAELPKSEPSSPEKAAPEHAAVEETTIADALRGLAEAPARQRLGTGDARDPRDAPLSKVTPSSSRGAAAAPVSSLESIPNPIPRRPTGNFENPSLTPSPPGSTKVSPASSRAVRSPTPPAVSSTASLPASSTAAGFPSADTMVAVRALPPSTKGGGSPVPPASAPTNAAEPAVTVEGPASSVATEIPAREARTSPPPPLPSRDHATVSFVPLWHDSERDAARQAEAALASGDGAGALLVCDVLVTRLLASAAGLTGNAEAPRDPGVVVLLLGLDGRRYLAFRAAVRAARAHETLMAVDALEAYLFALEVRRALTAVGW